jgi:hypothetical protein
MCTGLTTTTLASATAAIMRFRAAATCSDLILPFTSWLPSACLNSSRTSCLVIRRLLACDLRWYT